MTTEPDKAPRLYIDAVLGAGVPAPLTADQTHYLTNVMRLNTGDAVRAFNATQGEWQATFNAINKKTAGITPQIQRRKPRNQAELHLFCAPIKRTHFDFMIMKATELGVSHIRPILTSRTQIREINLERCRAIAIEAAEQSERLSVPKIQEALPLQSATNNWDNGLLPLICAELGEAQPIYAVLQQLAHDSSARAAIIVGPEGGFTAEELQIMKRLPGATALRLGPCILRADTAALAALSCWQAICGDWLYPLSDVNIAHV